MVSNPILGKIVRPNLIRTVARTNQRTAFTRLFGIVNRFFCFINTTIKALQSNFTVLNLRTPFLTFRHDTRWNVRNPNRRFSLVDVLPSRTRCAKNIDFQVVFADFNVFHFKFWHHHNGCRRGMNAPFRLRFGNPLHAVRARFKFEFAVNVLARDCQNQLAVTAERTFGDFHCFGFPALAVKKALVHTV